MKVSMFRLTVVLGVILGSPALWAQTRWRDDVRITDLTRDAESPQLAALQDRTLYMACSLGDTTNAGLYRSVDGGRTWELDRYIASTHKAVPLSIVVAEGELPAGRRLLVALKATGGPPSELRVWWLDLDTGSSGYSTVWVGDGVTHAPSVRLSVDFPEHVTDCRAYAGYEIFDSGTVSTSYHFALSQDQGATWTNYSYIGGSDASSGVLDLDYGHGVVYYVYDFAWEFSPPEIRLRRSFNRGVTWESYRTIDSGYLESPCVAAGHGDSTVIACYENYTGPFEELEVRVSRDRGTTWSPVEPPNDPNQRDIRPDVVFSSQDEKVALAWNRLGENQIMTSKCDPSSPDIWMTPVEVIDSGGGLLGLPTLALDASRDNSSCVAWCDSRDLLVKTIWFDGQRLASIRQKISRENARERASRGCAQPEPSGAYLTISEYWRGRARPRMACYRASVSAFRRDSLTDRG
jgi:hypothetical protein